MDTDVAFAPAVELARRVRTKDLSPVELVETCLRRIKQLDGQLNSVVTVDADGAMEAARQAEARAGEPDTPVFHGVPIAIKDLHLTRGLRTTFATSSLDGYVPDVDEENVRRLRAAGFLIIGKTNVPELGSSPVTESALLGPCRNPWDTSRTPGGSSGGAAAALAAGLVPVAHGSDGGGSIRIPAAHCGVFGLKPSRGRVSNAPLFGERAAGLGTTGPITRHVVDAAAMLDVMAGYVAGDPYWAPPPPRPFTDAARTDPAALRIGLVTTAPLVAFHPETVAVAESAAQLLEKLGHTVEPLELPIGAEVEKHFEVVWTSGVAAAPLDPTTLEPFNAGLYERGQAVSAPRLLHAITGLQLAARDIVAVSLDYDVLLSPTMAEPPLPIGAMDELDVDATYARAGAYVGLTPVANITGQPSMSLPLGWSSDGLPLGVMVTGRPADEATLLSLAGQLQRHADWSPQRPRVS